MRLIRSIFICIILTAFICSCSLTSSQKSNDNSTGTFILKNGNLVDGTGAAPVSGSIVVIESGKIIKAGKQSGTDIPKGARVVDLKGATVLPGFINAHVHRAYDEATLQKWLKSGVTTVRDLGPFTGDDYLAARDTLNKNESNAFLVSSNRIMAPPGGYGSLNYDSPEDARNKVLDVVKDGVDIVKISIEDDCQGRTWEMPTYEEIESIVSTAHSEKMKVSAHITRARNLQWAIDAGVDDVAHMVVEAVDADTVRQMVGKNMYWIPTLELWHGVSLMHSLNWDKIAAENLKRFYEAGGKIALGTDFAGYSCDFDEEFPITEANHMKEAGMSNMDIIVAGTRNAAFVCGKGSELGTLEPGKKADLLIVDGDPLKELNDLTKTKMVIHNGRIIVNNFT